MKPMKLKLLSGAICLAALTEAVESALADDKPASLPPAAMPTFPTTLQDGRFQTPLAQRWPSSPTATSARPSFHVPAVPKMMLSPVTVGRVIPNGCGSDASFFSPSWVLQSFGRVDLRKACDPHDICYGSLWADKIACDDRFALDLYRSCLTTPGTGRAMPLCLGLATTYYAGVRFGGGEAFQEAQMQALRPPQIGPNLFGPPEPFTERFSLLPRAAVIPKYGLGVDTNLKRGNGIKLP